MFSGLGSAVDEHKNQTGMCVGKDTWRCERGPARQVEGPRFGPLKRIK